MFRYLWTQHCRIWFLLSYKWNLNRIIADHLPKNIVYWATIRLMVKATIPPYGSTEVPQLTCVEALDRWSK